MRISDWSSDVCSSDLGKARHKEGRRHARSLACRVLPGEAQAVALLDRDGGEDEAEARHQIGHAEEDQQQDEAQPRSGSRRAARRSEEHTSELQSLMRISYAVFCLKKKKNQQ